MRRDETHAEWLARTDAREARISAAQHYVYRTFDSYGLLLYIGCTLNVSKRMGQHRSQSEWAPFAETVATYGPYLDKATARAVESEAIESEGAYFNAMPDETKLLNRLRVASQHRANACGIFRPHLDVDRLDDERHISQHDALYDRWEAACERARIELLGTALFAPLRVTRMDRYRAAREDAELARLESEAAA